jgi:hypothetical protein
LFDRVAIRPSDGQSWFGVMLAWMPKNPFRANKIAHIH